MLKAARLSRFIYGLLIFSLVLPFSLKAEESVTFKKNETGLGHDIFEQNFFYEGTNFLHLDRLYRAIFHKKVRAKDINIFDEVSDNTFFTNRHAKKALTAQELANGFHENDGPDGAGKFTIERGRFGETNTRIFVKDSRGDDYILKFDHADHIELETGAEVVANRIYYALGYNVPQINILNLDASQLVPGEGTKVVDGTGFYKHLTTERLEQYLMFLAQNDEGKYRVVASKLIPGDLKGGFKFQGRRRNDLHDLYDHEDRRELRALRVFASWLNHVDIRPHNTVDALQMKEGQPVLMHYLVDMDSSFGADSFGAKPANFGHENMFDFGETTKAIFGLGLWEKPWQKRWKDAGEKTDSVAVGYFNNNRFSPNKFKTQLPNYMFKDLSLADAFWAAKQMMSFKNEDIQELVKTGQYSQAGDVETISKTLIERRDLIAKFWFGKANPLDAFDVQAGKFVFDDLAVKYGFEQASGSVYHVDVISQEGNRGKRAASFTANEPNFALSSEWGNALDVLIRVSRSGSSKLSPYVLVGVTDGKVVSIRHQD